MADGLKKITMAEKKNMVKISELNMYPEALKLSDYRFIEEDPIPLQSQMTVVRKNVEPLVEKFSDQIAAVGQFGKSSRAAYEKARKYLTEEETSTIPKAVAITVGGMGGFLVGLKRGGVVTRTFYTGLGLGVVAAFCYPHQTLDLARSASAKGGEHYKEFFAAKAPVEKPTEEKGAEVKKSKDIDLYTTRSEKIS